MKEIKVVAIISSANYNGSGAELARAALNAAEKQGASVTEIFLQKKKLNYCTGCLKCITNGKCLVGDDFEEIKSILYDANGIIMCSPTFCGDMNAAMKNLLDRLGMYEFFTSMLGGKYVIGISTASGVAIAKKTAKKLASVVSNGLFKRSFISGTLGVSIRQNKVSEKSDGLLKASELGEKLIRDIKENKNYYSQNILSRIVLHNFVRPSIRKYIIAKKQDETKAVYDNLYQRGLL